MANLEGKSPLRTIYTHCHLVLRVCLGGFFPNRFVWEIEKDAVGMRGQWENSSCRRFSSPHQQEIHILNKNTKLSCLVESEHYRVFDDNGCAGLGCCLND